MVQRSREQACIDTFYYKAYCNYDITHNRECGKSEKSRKFQRLLEEKHAKHMDLQLKWQGAF